MSYWRPTVSTDKIIATFAQRLGNVTHVSHASIIYLWGASQAKLSRQNVFPSFSEWARHEAQGLDGLRSVPDPIYIECLPPGWIMIGAGPRQGIGLGLRLGC